MNNTAPELLTDDEILRLNALPRIIRGQIGVLASSYMRNHGDSFRDAVLTAERLLAPPAA